LAAPKGHEFKPAFFHKDPIRVLKLHLIMAGNSLFLQDLVCENGFCPVFFRSSIRQK